MREGKGNRKSTKSYKISREGKNDNNGGEMQGKRLRLKGNDEWGKQGCVSLKDNKDNSTGKTK